MKTPFFILLCLNMGIFSHWMTGLPRGYFSDPKLRSGAKCIIAYNPVTTIESSHYRITLKQERYQDGDASGDGDVNEEGKNHVNLYPPPGRHHQKQQQQHPCPRHSCNLCGNNPSGNVVHKKK